MQSETLKLAIHGAFELPTMMLPADASSHWPLSEKEGDLLAKRLSAVVDMLPTKIKTRGTETLAKIAAPVALLVTAFLLVKPRIDMTRDALARMNTVRNPIAPEFVSHVDIPSTIDGDDAKVFDITAARNTATVRQDAANIAGSDSGAGTGSDGRIGHSADVSHVGHSFSDAQI